MAQRELIRLSRNPFAVVISLLMPFLFLVVLGTGLNTAVGSASDDTDYRTYLLPGVLVMVVLAPAVNTGVSIVWDRRAGFLREMLVAPVHRSALIAGICLGGALAATSYGGLMLLLAALFGITFDPFLLAPLLLELLVITLALTALGALAAVSITRIETFQAVVGLTMMPLIFLSGAVFPVSGLPGWLNAAVLANPLSYGVDALRRTLFPDLGASTGLDWGGWQPSVTLEIALIGALTLLALFTAARRFSRIE
ncbi:ABC transporter permease [Streptomyces sp. NPDC094034]|uniref:ABC transporter permease n=1 Tax=Streptomyces sp. NPDC094034 TaxID=3155309 RepID=UPI00332668C8